MIGVYKITSPSGKIYIGQSTDIERRFKHYGKLQNCKGQVKLYSSLKKYGSSTHIFEIIEECKVEELNERERYWQDHYQVLERGLNLRLTETGDLSGYLSKDTVRRLSKIRKKLYNTPRGVEIRARQVLNTDYKSIARKLQKPVLQYSIEGLLLKEWDSIRDIENCLDIQSSDIVTCCKGRQQSAGGFIWRYRGSTVQEQIEVGKVGKELQDQKRYKRPVEQYSVDGSKVAEWESIRKAIEITGIRTIGDCLRNRQKTAGGFIWKYKN